jgi:hypothetical protein
VPIEVYNASETDRDGVQATYVIEDDQKQTVARGTFDSVALPVGKNNALGTVILPLSSLSSPAKYTLTVSLAADVKNHWEFWVYPATVPSAEAGNEKQRSASSNSSLIPLPSSHYTFFP